MDLTRVRSFIFTNHRLLFYFTWLFLGLAQSAFTELQDDEAYYWIYSKYPDWGYFDHPPAIAILIKAGYAIFPNELGVRIFPLLLNVLTLAIIEKLVYKKDPVLFYSIALSVAALQLIGFMAVPDTPLLFFTALFFLRYKRFTEKESWLNTIFLGIVMSLLVYSKYHGALIILFTIVSNPKLLTRYKAWFAVLISIACFVPHLAWQYNHDWVSIRYHLFESNVNPYKFSHTINYILGQLLLPGPIVGLLLIPAALIYRPANKTERAMLFTLIGLYLFFLLSTLKGKTELNWTLPVLVPLFVLAFNYISDRIAWRKILFRLLPITLSLVLFARIVMIEDVLPVKGIRNRFHAWKEWPAEMKKRTKGLPVVFSNSYQRASKYWFYAGQMTYSQNLYKEHRNNYNFWPIEDSLLGKAVYYMDIYDLDRFPDTLKTSIGWIGYRYDSAFSSFAKVRIIPSPIAIPGGLSAQLMTTASVELPDNYRSYLNRYPGRAPKLIVALFDKRGWVKDIETAAISSLTGGNAILMFDPEVANRQYRAMFCLGVEGYRFTQNSDKFKITLK